MAFRRCGRLSERTAAYVYYFHERPSIDGEDWQRDLAADLFSASQERIFQLLKSGQQPVPLGASGCCQVNSYVEHTTTEFY